MEKIKYQPHIDGLRAIAVISVLLFHAKIPGFKGGFIGVDIFFVISGFLLTKILSYEIASNKFSYYKFFEKKVRRLFPALVPVVIFSSFVAYKFYLPEDFLDYAKSLIASFLYSSNWYFLFTSGYWDGPSETKFLLHIWSLSLEEQFYLCFPLLLIANYRFKQIKQIKFIPLIGVLSFIYCVFLVHTGNSDAAYFDSFSRFWEFILGYNLATYPKSLGAVISRIRISRILGLAAILFAIFTYSEETIFPGFSALIPTLGALFFVAEGGKKKDFLSSILEHKYTLYVGKISYSLYLWHWPIIVCVNYYYDEPPLIIIIGALVVSVIMAIFSFHFIETPFRQKQVLSTKSKVFSGYLFTNTAILCFCLYILQGNGLIERFSESFQKSFTSSSETWSSQCQTVEFSGIKGCSITQKDSFKHNDIDVIVWGDSLATTVGEAFEKLAFEKNLDTLIISNPSCPSILDIWKKRDVNQLCRKTNDKVMNLAQDTNADLFLVSAWNDLASTTKGPFSLASLDKSQYTKLDLEKHIQEKLKILPSKLPSRNIYVLEQPPRYQVQIDTYVARNLLLRKPLENLLSQEKFKMKSETTRSLFTSASKLYKYIEVSDIFCPSTHCTYAENNTAMYHDGLHLNLFGAKKLYPPIESIFTTVN